MQSSEDNTPVHCPRRRLVEHSVSYGSPACRNLPYGQQHQLIVRGSPRHSQYSTTAAQQYFMAPAVRREPVVQQPAVADPDVDDDNDWVESCWRMLTCDGLCSGSPTAAADGEGRRSQALMVDVVSRVLFPIMFIIFNIIYWPIYLM